MAGDRPGDRPGARPSASERALAAARSSLRRLTPEYSAYRQLTFVQTGALLAAILLGAAAFLVSPMIATSVLSILGALIFLTLVLWRLVAAFAAISFTPRAPTRTWTGALPVYTILCPLYREARVLPELVERLSRLDYPVDKLDIKIILEADDGATIDAARAIAWPAHFDIIVAPTGHPRTKPKPSTMRSLSRGVRSSRSMTRRTSPIQASCARRSMRLPPAAKTLAACRRRCCSTMATPAG